MKERLVIHFKNGDEIEIPVLIENEGLGPGKEVSFVWKDGGMENHIRFNPKDVLYIASTTQSTKT